MDTEGDTISMLAAEIQVRTNAANLEIQEAMEDLGGAMNPEGNMSEP